MAGAESPTCVFMKAATEVMPPSACKVAMEDIAYSQQKIAKDQKMCDFVAQKVCEAVGPTTRVCERVKRDSNTFSAERCTTMAQHITEVISELKGTLLLKEPLSPEQQVDIAQGATVTFGPQDAKVQIVEFTEFECVACARMARIVRRVYQEYGDRVRIVVRHDPLDKHHSARLAAEASLFAYRQGKFWELHDRLFESKSIDRAILGKLARDLELDMTAFTKSLDGHEFTATVEADVRLSERIPIGRIPAVYINGARVEQTADYGTVTDAIEAALKSAQ
jgi:protein-disulfide isomerase